MEVERNRSRDTTPATTVVSLSVRRTLAAGWRKESSARSKCENPDWYPAHALTFIDCTRARTNLFRVSYNTKSFPLNSLCCGRRDTESHWYGFFSLFNCCAGEGGGGGVGGGLRCARRKGAQRKFLRLLIVEEGQKLRRECVKEFLQLCREIPL